jgi:hypothetical protein
MTEQTPSPAVLKGENGWLKRFAWLAIADCAGWLRLGRAQFEIETRCQHDTEPPHAVNSIPQNSVGFLQAQRRLAKCDCGGTCFSLVRAHQLELGATGIEARLHHARAIGPFTARQVRAHGCRPFREPDLRQCRFPAVRSFQVRFRHSKRGQGEVDLRFLRRKILSNHFRTWLLAIRTSGA